MANTTETTPKAPKMVKIILPVSRLEKNAEWASVNGEKYLIKRGVEVEVPEYIAKVLQRRDELLNEALAYEEQAMKNANQ